MDGGSEDWAFFMPFIYLPVFYTFREAAYSRQVWLKKSGKSPSHMAKVGQKLGVELFGDGYHPTVVYFKGVKLGVDFGVPRV